MSNKLSKNHELLRTAIKGIVKDLSEQYGCCSDNDTWCQEAYGICDIDDHKDQKVLAYKFNDIYGTLSAKEEMKQHLLEIDRFFDFYSDINFQIDPILDGVILIIWGKEKTIESPLEINGSTN